MLIKQRLADDCTICSIVMATGIPYERVLQVARSAEHGYTPGKGTASTVAVLQALGIKAKRAYRKTTHPRTFWGLLWGRKAIVELPSLNDFDGHHDLYWDGQELLDPSNQQTYPAEPGDLAPWVVTLVPVG